MPVNEAIEQACQTGILTAASLMMSAPATGDAIERARRLPNLGVGLHLVLVDGCPLLPSSAIPDLVGADGRFSTHFVRTGINIFFRSSTQRQVEAEIRAQFQAFQKTGLLLDHVNGHHHYHQHPTVLKIIIKLAREFNVRAVRVPYEPFLISWLARREGMLRRLTSALFQRHRTSRMKTMLKRANISYNDCMFGLNDSGHMNSSVLQQFLAHLPRGISELYCHPATSRWTGVDALPDSYVCEQEFEGLIDPVVIACLEKFNICKTTFTAAIV